MWEKLVALNLNVRKSSRCACAGKRGVGGSLVRWWQVWCGNMYAGTIPLTMRRLICIPYRIRLYKRVVTATTKTVLLFAVAFYSLRVLTGRKGKRERLYTYENGPICGVKEKEEEEEIKQSRWFECKGEPTPY